MREPLFGPKALRKLCKDIEPTVMQREAADKWLDLLKADKLENEEPNYLRFANTILHDILGYDPESGHHKGNVEFVLDDSKGTALVCVEAKGTSTHDLFARQYRPNLAFDTPIHQALIYKGELGLKYAICTNYRKFILLTEKGSKQPHEFDFEDIRNDTSKLREFIGVFSKTRLEAGFVESLKTESEVEKQDLTDEFYSIYKNTRLMLIQEFEDSGASKQEAVKYAQTFLNRVTFILFARDTHLTDNKDIFTDVIVSLMQGYGITSNSKMVWSYITDSLFNGFNKGSEEPKLFGFNGGLFRERIPPDMKFYDLREVTFFDESARAKPILKNNAPVIRDNASPIIVNLLALASYDFQSEIPVSMLGHIFENSIQEIEKLLGMNTLKRKREGVFYTPEYVTKYICQNTILPYLSKSGNATDTVSLVTEYSNDLPLLERRLKDIRVLDPACGSGAFLIEAAHTLLEVHQEIWQRKTQANTADVNPLYDAVKEAEMQFVVRSNIYGIDINTQSTEIAKLSLFLLTASKDEKLPDLSNRLVTGNSVISDKSFDWEAVFPDVFSGNNPGFDVIIGNPPYVRHESLHNKDTMDIPQSVQLDLPEKFAIPNKSDLSSYFYYHSIGRLKRGGMLGFITSESWLHVDYGRMLQQFLLDNCNIDTILRPTFNVFTEADTKTVITILRHETPVSTNPVKMKLLDDWSDIQNHDAHIKSQGEFEVGNWMIYLHGDMPEPTIDLVRMTDAGLVQFGKKTGHNDFFVLTKEVIDEYGIPEEYRKPVISENIHSGLLSDLDAIKYFLDVNEVKGSLVKTKNGRRVMEYIKKGEAEKIPVIGGGECTVSEKSSVRTRNPWYSLKLSKPPSIFLARFGDRRMKVYENNGSFYALDRFITFTPKNKSHIEAILAFLMSSWFLLHQEKYGQGHGGGLLEFPTKDYKRAPVPDFNTMSENDVNRMKKAWLAYRDDFDMKKLDGVVLGILGFNESKQTAIKNELKMFVGRRTRKV